MWSDTLLLAERAYLEQIILWAAASILAGSALGALVTVRRERSALLLHFAIQMGIWGVAELLLAGLCWRGLTERDLSGAASLERMLWLGAGLDAGCIAVGATLAVAGWRMRRGLGLVGAGVGITLQGAALLALAMHFISTLARLTIAR